MESTTTRDFVIDNTPEVGRVNTFLCDVSQGRGYIHFFNVDIDPCPMKLPNFKEYNTSIFIVKLFIKSKQFISEVGYARDYHVDDNNNLIPTEPHFWCSSNYKYYADVSTLEVIPIEIKKRMPSNAIVASLEHTDTYVDGGAAAVYKLDKIVYSCLEMGLDISDFSFELDKDSFINQYETRYCFNTSINLIEKDISLYTIDNYQKAYDKLIHTICVFRLDQKEYAKKIYDLFCQLLKIKYGHVDSDYDDNPTKRGNEWLDIHHIKEDELDDIAKRTEAAKSLEKIKPYDNKNNLYNFILYRDEYNDDNIQKIRNENPGKNTVVYHMDYSLEDLKPYNKKEMLVYANRIEHFLIHYLISIIRGKEIFSGGPNYLWDSVVCLDLYGFDYPIFNKWQLNKDNYYSLMSPEDVTLLYRKLIVWGKWELTRLPLYWTNYKTMIKYLVRDNISHILDKDKFYKLIHMIGIDVEDEIKEKIDKCPYLEEKRFVNGKWFVVRDHTLYSEDKKTVYVFGKSRGVKKFTVPNGIEVIEGTAFDPYCKEVVIPISVQKMSDHVFKFCMYLEKIHYKGTQEMWDEKFSNVDTNKAKVICGKTPKK